MSEQRTAGDLGQHSADPIPQAPLTRASSEPLHRDGGSGCPVQGVSPPVSSLGRRVPRREVGGQEAAGDWSTPHPTPRGRAGPPPPEARGYPSSKLSLKMLFFILNINRGLDDNPQNRSLERPR